MLINPYESPKGIVVYSWQWLKKLLYVSLVVAGIICIANGVWLSIIVRNAPYNSMTPSETLQHMVKDVFR